ncbi:MAG TPA: hypothetical protein VGG39_38095 [Polyangiaceae bacterium]
MVIDPGTGSLALAAGRIDAATSRADLRAMPVAAGARWDDMHTGWVHVELADATGTATFAVRLLFEGERLDGYRMWMLDPRFGTSWDDWSEEKQRAQQDAHDAWLIGLLGPGTRRPTPGGPELAYSLPWGEVWSAYDPRSGSSTIGVRFR